MNTYLDDAELDALLRECDPIDPLALQRTVTSTGAQALRTAIVQSGATPTRRRFLRPAVLAAAVAVATAIPLAFTLVSPTSHDSAYGAELVRFAEHSPRLLVGAGGWRVTRADEESTQTGEMTFSSGTRSLDVFWVAGAHEKDTDKFDMKHVATTTIDSSTAWVGAYDAHEFEAIWSVGDQAREARGNFADLAEFLAVATTLYRVDVDTWLDAMPATVVNPKSRAATVEQMLADVPLPKGFDQSTLDDGPGVSDRYQLGAHVVGAVSCAWIHQWSTGTAAQRSEASAAMATSRNWAILREMASGGAYPDVVWEIADALNGKPLRITPGQTLEKWSKPALGC